MNKITEWPDSNRLDTEHDAVESMIMNQIKQMEYGEVKITVHNSRVVQLETTDKVRFQLKPKRKGGL